MNYGQSPQLGNTLPEQDFFTAGVGANSENVNTPELENNLDLTNQQTDWSLPAEISSRELGNLANNQLLNQPNNHQLAPEMSEASEVTNDFAPEQMGQVIEITSPPVQTENLKPEVTSYNKSNLKIEENLGKAGISEVNRAIDAFSDKPNTAYENYQNMREAALDESFGRKIGEQKA